MYLLDDGRVLEMSFDRSSPYTTTEQRSALLAQIRDSDQPVQIAWQKGRGATPVEAIFLKSLIDAGRKRRIRISTTSN